MAHLSELNSDEFGDLNRLEGYLLDYGWKPEDRGVAPTFALLRQLVGADKLGDSAVRYRPSVKAGSSLPET